MKCKRTPCPSSVLGTTFVRLALAVSAMACTYANSGGWVYHSGKGYTLCDELHKRLNSFTYPDPKKHLNASCGWNAALSYPGFKQPPWQELDVTQHEELIYHLIKYTGSPNGLTGLPGSAEQFIREDVRQFIALGGRVQLWRTRLITDFFNKNHPEVWAPPGLQNVVQLRYQSHPANLEADAAACPGIPRPGWYGRVFIVNDELTDVHPDMGHAGTTLAGYSLVLYRKRPHLLSRWGSDSVSVGWDTGSGPHQMCQIDFNFNQSRRK